MFNQEPVEEQGQVSEAPGQEAEAEAGNLTEPNTDYTNQKPEIENQTLEFTNLNLDDKVQQCDLLKRSCSEPSPQVSNCSLDHSSPEGCGCRSRRSCCSEEAVVGCVLQVDNGSEGDDSFLQREGSQRRSRRRFRRVNPKGERELITDGQDPAGYNTVRAALSLSGELELNFFRVYMLNVDVEQVESSS